MTPYIPPHVTPNTQPLGMLASLKAVRQNVLQILPAIAYKQPIVTGRTGPARWHMVQGPEGLKRLFLDNADNYPKSEVMIRMLRSAVGTSLFTSEGDHWRWQRRAIAPVFSARNVDALAPVMTATAERAVERLSKTSEPVEMVSEMLSSTFEVICDVALSGREHFDAETYGAAITRYFLTVGRASLLDFLEAPHWIPRPGELLGAGSVRTMHRMVSQAIDARRKQESGAADDLLDYMLRAKDPQTGRSMSSKDLLHNMQFFIVAGHETTALALSWALLLLANDPKTQEHAASEAQTQLGTRAANPDDLNAMPAINAIILEAMRLYPPVGLLARNVLRPDRIYDRDIKTGDTIFLNIYSLHRHQMLWDNPDGFDPSRFSAEATKKRDRYEYLPFGAGPRICVGANFAMMQAQIILATLLANFKFTAVGQPPKPVMHMTIRPEPGVYLKAERRK